MSIKERSKNLGQRPVKPALKTPLPISPRSQPWRLRQMGNVPGFRAGQGDRARKRRKRSRDALEQSRFAGTVRAANREQRAALDLAIEVMHRRMAVVAKREIAETNRNVHQG